MIRHISMYRVEDPAQCEKMRRCLQEAGERSPLVKRVETGVNMTSFPEGASHPPFADLIQMLEFAGEEDCAAWPLSKEHRQLVEKTKELSLLCAIDWKTE